MTAFLLSLAAVAGVALLASAAGWAACRVLVPAGPETRFERAGWSFAVGCALIASLVPLSFVFGLRPGWPLFLLAAAFLIAMARFLRLPLPAREGRREERFAGDTHFAPRWLVAGLLAFVLFGVLLYTLRALTEPMWSNDFLAIWGFKGKTIFYSGAVPPRLYDWKPLAFSHPEYPLGLPFLYAGVSFLRGSWDDHAMAILFPLVQVATLCVLFGWLRRRGASAALALGAAVLIAMFEPLYSAFQTGMAEVPLALGLLLFGTALVDCLDATGAGALRRLAVASALIAALKNEGLFLAAAGFAIALLSGGSRRLQIGLAALAPALTVYGLHVAWRGRVPLSDLDFTLFSPARVAEALGAAARVPGLAGWLGLAALAVLIAAGTKSSAGERLLVLAALGLAAYLALPVFAVRGPAWLIDTTLLRTASALAPLVAAGVAVRFRAPGMPAS